ncbi:MAG: hypothetical protein SXA11_07985 [Cyanobacteriota bacterium]|nr:hypothetical protein [Cyanobacteriota bacterium]
MRDTSSWRERLGDMRDRLRERSSSLNFSAFCDIELGLYLLVEIAPDAPASSLWVLLTGYDFPATQAQHWGERERRMLANARHILTQFRSEYGWARALQLYRETSELLRGFDVDENLERFSSRQVSVASNREAIYANALERPLGHSRQNVRWASAGRYECSDRSYRVTLEIPDDLIFPEPASHDLTGTTQRDAISVSWQELLETARWMDAISNSRWEQRLSAVRLELFEGNDALQSAGVLTLEGMMHLIGMVSSGKSTLMDILAVWAAKNGFHVTIVVGDVISALNRCQAFHRFGIPVAPILGASNRDRHTNRLHRAWNAEHPLEQFQQQHVGFRWLSTACPLSELRRDVATPFESGKQPCTSLRALSTGSEEDKRFYACPIYNACPSHQGQRDLVDAKIWIATPASLVYTRVARQTNAESIRFSELVCRRSDLVIVDEADQVQVQLDNIFSPSQKLFGPGGDGWLSQVQETVVSQLNQQGRGQLADPDVDRWCKAHEIAQTATSRIYALILKQPPALREWIQQGDYFTDWLIFNRLAIALADAPPATRDEHEGYGRVMEVFANYIDDPIGDRANNPLCELARLAISVIDEDLVLRRLGEWINENKEPAVVLTEEQLENATIQLYFGLLVAIVQNRLNRMVRDWKNVEVPLKLEAQSSMLFYSPPRDYEATIPVSPMGNVLALQYVGSNDSKPGDLRFFKCMGVGRWLLLHLHELLRGDSLAGPHVLLLSGTSWAGKAPGYHVQVPVAGVLRSPDSELQALDDSYFEFTPFYDGEGNPITVSGSGDRDSALKEILNKLAKPGGLGGPSKLEVERDRLPQGRERILLLVGSYQQTKLVREHLEHLRPEWRGQIWGLVRDDDEFGTQWSSGGRGIQRGLVHQFASTGAWILIAPLMAIERGHNILNDENKAALGAAYFLVRPHPRPDDISYAIHSIDRWAIDRYNDTAWLSANCENGSLALEEVGQTFRDAAYRRWRYLLRLPMIYSTLPQEEREAVTWNQLVSIWQAIGRLIRGGSPARVFFCDAAFARRTAFSDELGDEPLTSLLVSIKEVLGPYFVPDSDSQVSDRDRALVQALYGPFYRAIENIGGIAE